MAHKIIAEHSKFWLGDNFSPTKAFDENSMMDLIKLAAYRRAVANFVYILTGKNIPVRFAEKATSFTDGKEIHIGGELSKGAFDPTVGLSLHEAMHIVKSDFDLVKLVWGKLPQSVIKAAKGKYTPDALGKYAKYVLNVVEDRYIDAWAYENAPGYRGYYQALYTRYFYDERIGEGLKSDAFRTATLRNYKFRFTNIVNPNSDLDALPALRKISELLDLENMIRPELETPEGRLDLAYAITEEIVKSAVEEREEEKKEKHREQQKNQSSNEDGDSDEGSDEGSEEGTSSKTTTEAEEKEESEESDDTEETKSEKLDEESDEESDDGEDDEDDSDKDADSADEDESDPDDLLGGVEASSDPVVDDPAEEEAEEENPSKDLSKKELAALDKLIEQQEEFIMREMKQTAFSDEMLKKMAILEQSDVNIVAVGGEEGIPQTDCVVVKNMTEELMFAGEFPLANRYTSNKTNPEAEKGVIEGIAFGTMLGRKLQMRSEVKTTKFSRLVSGKIDRRLLSAIGFNSENLFYQTAVDKYKNVHLHVTVDASSSMATKWCKTMATVVAMAKAASMITNVSMSISFRTGTGTFGKELAYVVMAYDSRKDKFSKITTLFPMLFPSGSTPEGLAFQAILDNIPATTHELDSYFINISDGEPAFNGVYHGMTAALHTKKQVGKIRETGVTVLSYFIEHVEEPVQTTPKKNKGDDKDAAAARIENNTMLFKTMYGKDAQFIDVENIVQVAYTMNKKFLTKEN